MRTVIDTNIIVSAFLTPQGLRAQVLAAWQQQQFQPLVSDPILTEYERALNYKEVASRHGLNPEEVQSVIADLRRFAVLVEPTEKLQVVQEDPDDDKFLECAVAGGAEYIVSGDPHLLQLKEYRGIQILTPREFLGVLEEERRKRGD